MEESFTVSHDRQLESMGKQSANGKIRKTDRSTIDSRNEITLNQNTSNRSASVPSFLRGKTAPEQSKPTGKAPERT